MVGSGDGDAQTFAAGVLDKLEKAGTFVVRYDESGKKEKGVERDRIILAPPPPLGAEAAPATEAEAAGPAPDELAGPNEPAASAPEPAEAAVAPGPEAVEPPSTEAEPLPMAQ